LENPFWPIKPLQGPPAGSQQARLRVQISTVATELSQPDATAVINWVASPVRANPAARLTGHGVATAVDVDGVTRAAVVVLAALRWAPEAHPDTRAVARITRAHVGFEIIKVIRTYWRGLPALVAGLVLVGCGGSADRASSPIGDTVTITTTSAPTTTILATTTTVPAFADTVSAVTAADVSYTWRAGCPVGPTQLRMIDLTYWGFDGAAHTGSIIVNTSVVPNVVQVFRTLYNERFPIEEMVPEDAYHGNDNLAAAADDTSGFNCRYAVAPGPPQWSVHAYGEAIDVDDVQNPYVDGSLVIPPSGAAYEDRSDVRPGMAVPGGELVEAFVSVGWYWGGRWTASPDYQHFSLTGG
jgi:hypothetical protein